MDFLKDSIVLKYAGSHYNTLFNFKLIDRDSKNDSWLAFAMN